MPLVDQIANSEPFTQRQAMLLCECEHILYGFAPLVITWEGAVSSEGLESARYDLFGRAVAARSELLLDQMLAT